MASNDEHRFLLDALEYIDPSRCSYQEWVDVGMALHESGFSCSDWDSWSRGDASRYHEGECERKWSGFGRGMGDHVKSGTIIAMAEAAGWVQPSAGPGSSIGWDDDITIGPDPSWVEPVEPSAGERMPAQQLYDYITALFDDDERVGYVVESFVRDGRAVPANKGSYRRTAGELCAALSKLDDQDDIGSVIGDWDKSVGAWIRFNPLDGNGVGNANVTEYRYALVESDELEYDRQLPMIRAMNLPCAVIVTSGKKSVHAIVRIDAGRDLDLYRKRVEKLYQYCRAHGFPPDTQNKNPSRLSRMPGVTRGDRMQELVAINEGAENWDAWEAWVAESEDDLPDEEVGNWDDPIVLKPPLIGQDDKTDCILRQGQKMIVVGDSKMGKSYTLIDLAEAICVGGWWLGLRCTKGKVFYVNLEIDPEEFRWRQHRVWDMRPERFDEQAKADINANFVHWPMRGHAAVMDDIAPKLIRRMLRYGPPGTFEVVVIDPIYKVNGGDDNDAKAVSRFTNQLDRISMACGCAIIYAHHHPKGSVGGRRSIDRMSGSGVYARDADTVLDFSPLYADAKAREQFGDTPLFRASVDVRSFGHRKAIDAMFKWPRFLLDPDGALARLKIVGEDPRAEGADRGKSGKAARDAESRQAKIDAVRAAIAQCNLDEVLATRKNVYSRLMMPDHMKMPSEETFANWTRSDSKQSLGPFSMDRTDGGKDVVVDDRTNQKSNN